VALLARVLIGGTRSPGFGRMIGRLKRVSQRTEFVVSIVLRGLRLCGWTYGTICGPVFEVSFKGGRQELEYHYLSRLIAQEAQW
jgi:hypothetical protein